MQVSTARAYRVCYIFTGKGGYVLDKSTPNCWIPFTAASMYIFDPLNRLAYTTAAPIERCYTDIASLPFPLTICGRTYSQSGESRDGKHVKETLLNTLQQNRPGGVPQHMFLSSMWLTSKPMNHDPSDTSSFAYLCRIGLRNITCIISFPLDEQTPFCMSWTLIKHTDWLKYKSQDLSKRHISAP